MSAQAAIPTNSAGLIAKAVNPSTGENQTMTALVIKEESRAFFRALGALISVLRKEQLMTQAELARTLGVSQQTVFAYELGDRRVSVLMLLKLAHTFDVPVGELMRLRAPPRTDTNRPSPAGLRHAERFKQLSKKHQRFVTTLMDVLLASGQPAG